MTEGKYEVRKDGKVYMSGPIETIPDKATRKALTQGGYRVYVNDKIYREEQNK